MTKPLINLLAAVAIIAGTHSAGASEFDAKLNDLAAREISRWVGDSVIVAAIRAQNQITRNYTDAEIASLDKSWRSEVGAPAQPTIDPVLDNAASEFLRGKREESSGLFTEIFVMDARGLNVAASDVTSDYWQGDEAKWQETYAVGPNAVHISEVEFDESTQTYQSQVSLSIIDPATGETIGAATVGVNVELLN
jgi:hypothetical protein